MNALIVFLACLAKIAFGAIVVLFVVCGLALFVKTVWPACEDFYYNLFWGNK